MLLPPKVVVFCIFYAFFTKAAMSGEITPPNLSNEIENSPTQIIDDIDAQITLEEIFKDTPDGSREALASWKTDINFNFDEALKDGSLGEKVKSIIPSITPEISTDTPPSEVISTGDAFLAQRTLWTSLNGANKVNGVRTIKVCWINPTNDNKNERNLVETATKSTWEYYGNIDFIGWKICTDDIRGIKIRINDERPYSYIGNTGEFKNPSMVLNFSFETPGYEGCRNPSEKNKCIWSTGVHEFGHALGLLHEQDRLDTKDVSPTCSAKVPPEKVQSWLQPTNLTKWDSQSVMNYCFDIYKNRVQLSDCDIAALQKMYGSSTNTQYKPKCKIE